MNPAQLARDGDLDALFDLMDLKSDSRADRDAYKWLCCAADFGHDTEELIGDVLEVSSLRYDDDGYEQAAAHWELAVAYLRESDGLVFDAALIHKHLDEALGKFTVEEIAKCTNESYDAQETLSVLDGEGKALLQDFLDDTPYRRVRHLLSSIKALRAIDSVPQNVLCQMGTVLAEEVRTLLGDDVEEGVYLPVGDAAEGDA